MQLRAYLDALDESAEDFAARSGVPLRTIYRVRDRDGCNARTALAIIRASHEKPTPGGGTIALEDLVIEDGDGAEA